jgi:membrane protein DedA with SNARE-associated domain
MTAPLPEVASAGPDRATGFGTTRIALIAAAAFRAALSLLAIPLAPVLYEDHFLGLILLRPTKEVLLAAGFEIRIGHLNVLEVYLAAIPMSILGTWIFFWLGREFSDEIRDCDQLPGIAGRLLPAKRIEQSCRLLEKKGTKVVFLGRLAVFPSSLMAAAAGASDMAQRDFLLADGLGGLAAITEVVLAGFILGEAYERAGIWLTAIGSVIAIGLLVAFGRWLRQDAADGGGEVACAD